MFRDFWGFWVLFSDSLGFFTSIALGFVPKDTLGLDLKPKHVKNKKLENLSKTRSVMKRQGAFARVLEPNPSGR